MDEASVVNRDEAKALTAEFRQFLTSGGSIDELVARIDDGISSSDDPGVIGLLILGRTLARQEESCCDELAADALEASTLLADAGEEQAAVFAQAVAGGMFNRAGDADAAADIAVRTFAALEQMSLTEEWGSRTANAVGILLAELHAFELAAESAVSALAWEEAATDPIIRHSIESDRAFRLLRAAEKYEVGSVDRAIWIAKLEEPLAALRNLDLPAARIVRNCVEAEAAFLTGSTPDPTQIESLTSLYPDCASSWTAWHGLVHGRTLNAEGRPAEAIGRLRHALDMDWPMVNNAVRKELARSLTTLGRTDQAVHELQTVLDDLEAFVRIHVARQARDLADRVDAERHAAELRQHSEVLANQVAEDHLTGVASRRALDERLEQSVDGEKEHAVLVCDLDHFKMINDAYGHQVGDDVLAQVGRILREHARGDDLAGRFGGEEFVVVMQSGLSEAAIVAERLRAAVEGSPWTTIEPDLRVTMSVGVAAGTAPLIDLLRGADLAVYDAKHGGRNRVSLASTGEGRQPHESARR